MTRHDIVPTHLAVMAMRDNGYKNAAYAIAELIDNSIQAGATQVELLCGDKVELRRQRRTSQVNKIAVLDNGSGMNKSVLRMALQFGNGMYLNPDNHTGIGRFGMGLPSSSISQCCKVEVWTWQDGVENAIYSYLDLDEIIAGDLVEVPEPQPSNVPETWMQIGKRFDQTGTLVVWSDIDRSLWRRSKTIIEKSEFVIGRIYRRFLAKGQTKIRFVNFDVASPLLTAEEWFAQPNDPLYLMPNTSCPSDLPHIEQGEPMFVEWGEPDVFHIDFNGGTYEVVVRYSIAKNEARSGENPGSRKHGKHAARNVGVSIIRADRELDLDPAWSDPSNARDRWWGVEVEFPPTLDDLFGVTNNKQSARYFSDLAKVNIDDMIKDEQTVGSAREEYEAEADPQWPLFEIASVVQKNITSMQAYLRRQKEGTRRLRDVEPDEVLETPEAKATEVTERRKSQGYFGQSDEQEALPENERIADIQQGLLDSGETEIAEEAHELAAEIVGRGFKYEFRNAALSTPGFFDVQSRGGKIIITLNTQHPAYPRLIEVLEEDVETADAEELRFRLVRAAEGLDLLLSAWARYEDEQPDGPRKDKARDARWDWGRMARDFLNDED